MDEISTIARPYAVAIFNLAKEEKALSEWSDMLSLMSGIIKNDDINVQPFTAGNLFLNMTNDEPSQSKCQTDHLILAEAYVVHCTYPVTHTRPSSESMTQYVI